MTQPADGRASGEAVLLVGLGTANRAVARALGRAGVGELLVVDDHPSAVVRAEAESVGAVLVEPSAPDDLRALIAGVDRVVPSPGVPDAHPAKLLAAELGVPIGSELDVAAALDPRPIVAITGTDGKTTVTTMVTRMLTTSGGRALAAGNNELPLTAAIEREDVDVFVVEASSFQLGHSRRFAPHVGTWLNFAADHLDVHRDLTAYEEAKASIWDRLAPGGVAIANAEDPVVMRHLRRDRRVVTFGVAPAGADGPHWRIQEGALVAPDGERLLALDELPRRLPHDVTNALAASATAIEAGASLEGVREVLATFGGLPHRVQVVGEAGGIRYVDDSKATAPHAALAAVRAFESVVLIAGGRNKGLDLTPLSDACGHLRAVVTIGEAAGELGSLFDGRVPVAIADSMREAVEEATQLASPGDVVLLSPGCASFDWYTGYEARGADFNAEVARVLAGHGPPGDPR